MYINPHSCHGINEIHFIVLQIVINIITGGATTIIIRMQYMQKIDGIKDFDGLTQRPYTHPFVISAFTYLGKILCTYIFIYVLCYQRNKNPEVHKIKLEWKSQLILAIPTCCDFFSTVLSSIGLLWVDSSVYQMLRGSLIIFVGIMSRLVFKRVLTNYQWSGIIFSCMGVIVVSLASIFGNTAMKSDTLHIIIGIVLILVGQLMTSVQMVLEEILVKKRNIEPLNVVGMEGVYGFILCCIALVVTYFLPGTSGPNGRQEDVLDAFKQLSNSRTLVATSIIYMISISFFNFSGISLTRKLSATNRTLLDTCRTCVVWSVGIILYYGFGLKDYGEAINLWSISKVDGFIFLIMGTVFYNMSNETEIIVPRANHISVSSVCSQIEPEIAIDASSSDRPSLCDNDDTIIN